MVKQITTEYHKYLHICNHAQSYHAGSLNTSFLHTTLLHIQENNMHTQQEKYLVILLAIQKLVNTIYIDFFQL